MSSKYVKWWWGTWPEYSKLLLYIAQNFKVNNLLVTDIETKMNKKILSYN